jgi:hypothetical protein
VGLLGLLVALYKMNPLRLLGVTVSFQQYYYMGVLSCLLIHYMLDAYLFTVSNLEGASVEQIPYAAAVYLNSSVSRINRMVECRVATAT